MPSGMLKYLWITFVVIFIDQITKWMAEASIDYTTANKTVGGIVKEVIVTADIIPVIPHLNWTFAYNYGAAFGFLDGARWFFVILAVVVTIAILIWLAKLNKSEKWTATGLALVLGGAVGNGIDRLLHGKVIDFIDVYADWNVFFLTKWHDGWSHFATFNVADIAINIGAVILIAISLFSKEEE